MNSLQFKAQHVSLALLFVIALVDTCIADTVQVPHRSSRDYGMSGVIASPQNGSALFNNPAGMSMAYAYAAEGQYIRLAERKLNLFGLNVVDSKTQPNLAVGMAYGYGFTDESADFDIKTQDGRLAFSTAFIDKLVLGGLGLRYVRESVGTGEAATVYDGLTLDAGFLLNVQDRFSLGLVGQNLMKFDGLNRRLGGGMALRSRSFVIDADLLVDFDAVEDEKTLIYRFGAEVLAGDSVPLRAGFEGHQHTDEKWMSFGTGFMEKHGNRASQINVSYRQNIERSDDNALSISVILFL